MFEVFDVSIFLVALDNNVINICYEVFAFLLIKHPASHPEKGWTCISQSLWHLLVAIGSPRVI